MSRNAIETAQPGPWEPWYGFRLPLGADFFDDGRQEAVAAFREALHARLTSLSCEFLFDARGVLHMRERDARPDVARNRPGPLRVFIAIRNAFLALDLSSEPPSYQPLQTPVPPEVAIESNRDQIRSSALVALQSLGRFLGLASAAPQRRAGRFRADLGDQDHANMQFANLQAWFEQQWREGKALHAIEGWHHRVKAREQRSASGTVLIAPGGEADLGGVRIRVSDQDDAATVEVRDSVRGGRLRLAVTETGWRAQWEDDAGHNTAGPVR